MGFQWAKMLVAWLGVPTGNELASPLEDSMAAARAVQKAAQRAAMRAD